MSKEWKAFKNPEVIHYFISNGNEWEILEYFAENNYEVFIHLINYHIPNSPYTRKKVVEHYKNENLDELEQDHPNLVMYIRQSQEYMKGLSKNGKKSGEYLKNL